MVGFALSSVSTWVLICSCPYEIFNAPGTAAAAVTHATLARECRDKIVKKTNHERLMTQIIHLISKIILNNVNCKYILKITKPLTIIHKCLLCVSIPLEI